jgi:hypothetical protein
MVMKMNTVMVIIFIKPAQAANACPTGKREGGPAAWLGTTGQFAALEECDSTRTEASTLTTTAG